MTWDIFEHIFMNRLLNTLLIIMTEHMNNDEPSTNTPVFENELVDLIVEKV